MLRGATREELPTFVKAETTRAVDLIAHISRRIVVAGDRLVLYRYEYHRAAHLQNGLTSSCVTTSVVDIMFATFVRLRQIKQGVSALKNWFQQ